MNRFGFRPKNGNFGAPKLQNRVFESKMVEFGPNGPILLARGGFNRQLEAGEGEIESVRRAPVQRIARRPATELARRSSSGRGGASSR